MVGESTRQVNEEWEDVVQGPREESFVIVYLCEVISNVGECFRFLVFRAPDKINFLL